MSRRSYPAVPGVSAAGHVTTGGAWHPGKADTCHKCHPTPRQVEPFETGDHDYEVTFTVPGVFIKPRIMRGSYLGPALGGGHEFNMRGPDRTHRAQYGGNQRLPQDAVIIAAVKVERDEAKRYTTRRA